MGMVTTSERGLGMVSVAFGSTARSWRGRDGLPPSASTTSTSRWNDWPTAWVSRWPSPLDYEGLFSVEDFDLPDLGLPLGDPLGHCVALADRVRPLLAA